MGMQKKSKESYFQDVFGISNKFLQLEAFRFEHLFPKIDFSLWAKFVLDSKISNTHLMEPCTKQR